MKRKVKNLCMQRKAEQFNGREGETATSYHVAS
jgi:hypothetical protein